MNQKQSGYFTKEAHEYRLSSIEERLQAAEETQLKKIEHLEDRVRQVNLKFDRIEQLGDRLESLNKLIDSLKTNFDAKLQVYEDKLTQLVQKNTIAKSKPDDIQQLYQLVKKALHGQKELQQELSSLKSRDIRQSEVLFKQHSDAPSQSMIINNINLKQSNVLDKRVQSPNTHQRIESYQKNDRVRSITLEKEKLFEQRLKQRQYPSYLEGQQVQMTEEDDNSQIRYKILKKSTNESQTDLMDKYQFTLQSKMLQDENCHHPLTNKSQCSSGQLTSKDRMPSKSKKSETLTLETGKIINQQTLLERTISQDHISKYLSSTNQIKDQLKNLRK